MVKRGNGHGKMDKAIRGLLAALHAAFAAAALVLLDSKKYLAYIFVWAPGLVALVVIVFTLHLHDSKKAVIASTVVALFSFGPATFIWDAVLSAGLFEGRSPLTAWHVAAFILFLVLEIVTIVFVRHDGQVLSIGTRS